MTRRPESANHPRAPASPLSGGMSRRQFLAAAGAGDALLLARGLPETASGARSVRTASRWNGSGAGRSRRRRRTPARSGDGDVLFNSTGTSLIGTRVGTSQIDSFRVASDGRLIVALGSPFAAQAVGPFGSDFRPTNPDQLFVSNAQNAAGDGTISPSASPATARWHRSGAHSSPMGRQRHAGSRSATTASSCSRSTRDRAASRATRSPRTAR